MNGKFFLRKVAVVAAVSVTAFTAWSYLRRGVEVIVVNTDVTEMRDVEVHVTGNSYGLGHIASNAQKRVAVRPSSESHVEITFIDAGDTKKRLVADCYFESRGYKGSLEVEIRDGEIVRKTDNIRVGMY